jgi:hypothetical protein
MNMGDAKLAGALGFEQITQPARFPTFTDQENAYRLSIRGHQTPSCLPRQPPCMDRATTPNLVHTDLKMADNWLQLNQCNAID